MSAARVPFSALAAQYASIEHELRPRVDAVLASGQYVLGPEVAAFESEYARYSETAACVAVNSGTSALHLALRCLDIGPGDEVIVPALTFVATAWAVSYAGATPVFVDIDPATRTLALGAVERALTERTRAVIAVHLYGHPADMEGLHGLLDARGVALIEDAAQAHGARARGRRVGSVGAIGCFSFYPGKNLGAAGEAGALVTHDVRHAARARALRDHAQRVRYQHDELGYNYRMDNLQGAVLRTKLPHLDAWNAARARHAAHYVARLEPAAAKLSLPRAASWAQPVWHLFVVEVDDRDRLAQRLRDAGIEVAFHYPVPAHLQPAYSQLGYARGACPHAERLADRCLSLPLYPELTDGQVDLVCDALLGSL